MVNFFLISFNFAAFKSSNNLIEKHRIIAEKKKIKQEAK